MDIKLRKGQVGIWVILGVVILALVIFLFYFRGEINPEVVPTGESLNEKTFIERCVEENVNEATEILLPQGGFVNPVNSRKYNRTEVEYLCENKGNYETCINQHPLLIKEIEKEIDNYISPRIENCFEELVSESQKDGVEAVIGSGSNIEVNLVQDKVIVSVDKKITFIENGQNRDVRDYKIEVVNSAYNLAVIAMEIAGQEAKHCYFEYVGFGAIYPRYKIKPFGISDSTTIYEIRDNKSNQIMRIAVRSCAIPPGI
ncbi:MAG: hypothetical protein KC506_00865 [Nanoarchaeota archaeon]|nr:hypothetical protein [Nanoarchaeota archaeon]